MTVDVDMSFDSSCSSMAETFLTDSSYLDSKPWYSAGKSAADKLARDILLAKGSLDAPQGSIPPVPIRENEAVSASTHLGVHNTFRQTVPLQIWEGVVSSVDQSVREMSVVLTDKMGAMEEHSADISLEWVPKQDQDLLVSGAIFYLTIYKETSLGGTLTNSQELRFRRQPYWTKNELIAARREARSLLSIFKKKPEAE